MTFSFKGHTVVVTGAGGGLGKAFAHHQVLKDVIDNCRTCLQLLPVICLEGSKCGRE